MAVNQVIFGDRTVIDISDSTVVPEKLAYGLTCYDKTGAKITGTLTSIPKEPYIFDLNYGYVDNGTWKYENPTNTYIDMYEAISGHTYFFTLGNDVGSRFRAMFTSTDVSEATANVVGTRIVNLNNPTHHANGTYTAPEDGYIIIAKDNVGKTGIKTYFYDAIEAWL